MQNLKEFINRVKLSPEIFTEVKGIISHFAFMLTLYKKYEDTFRNCGLIGLYSNTYKSIGWLLYIMARVLLLKNRSDIVESACLLIAMLQFIIINRPTSVTYKKPFQGNNITPSDEKVEVKTLLCGIFKLRREQALDSVENAFQKMVQQLIDTGILKKANNNIFDETNLDLNVMKLKVAYEQYVHNFDIDERLFIYGETSLASPCRLTPFARQGMVNVIFTPRKKNDFSSEEQKLRDLSSKSILTTPGRCSITLNTKLQDIQLTKHSLNADYSRNSQIVISTPISRAMEMNNWLQDHVSKYSKIEGLSPTLKRLLEKLPESACNLNSLIDSCIEKIGKAISGETNQQENGVDKKTNQIKSLYFCIVEELLLAEEKVNSGTNLYPLLQNESFHRSVLVAAAETTLFIHNTIALMFEELLDICCVSAFDFWKCLPYFLRFDSSIPLPLDNHFNEINKKILASIAWQKKSPIYALISQLMSQSNPGDEKGPIIRHAHELFFKSVLGFAAALIVDVTAQMNLTDDFVKEKIWEIMKHCLSVETDLMADRDLVQIVLCSIYAVCKMQQSMKRPTSENYTFNTIIRSYMNLNGKLADLYSTAFHVVKLDEKSFVNIIEFYNKAYLPKMKSALFKICLPDNSYSQTSTLPTSKAKIQILAPPSPLNESLPKGGKYATHSGAMRTQLVNSKFAQNLEKPLSQTPILTPRTKALNPSTEMNAMNIQTNMEISTFAPSFNSERRKAFKGALKDKILEQQRAIISIVFYL